MEVLSKLNHTLMLKPKIAQLFKLLLPDNQLQLQSMLKPGNSTEAESSKTAELHLTTVFWLQDILQLTGWLKTHGELLGECKVTLN
jgi:hypothetical protein